jgi:alpha-aminoadipate carrier protein LysW
MTATCPECDAPVVLSDQTRVNEVVECAECRAELELVASDPPLLGLAPEVEEDWGE